MKLKFPSLIILLLLLLTACAKAETPQSDQREMEVVTLQVTPELAHWLTDVNRCAEGLPNIGIVTQILPDSALDPAQADLILRLGERTSSDPQVAVMGKEEIVVITGERVPLRSLSIESLRAIFTGSIENWNEISENQTEQTKVDQPIEILTYPQGHHLRLLFSKTYLNSQNIDPDAQIASTSDAVIDHIQTKPYAIAYVLKSQVPSGINLLDVTDLAPLAAQHNVLAVTQNIPQGDLRQLLLCLQNSN